MFIDPVKHRRDLRHQTAYGNARSYVSLVMILEVIGSGYLFWMALNAKAEMLTQERNFLTGFLEGRIEGITGLAIGTFIYSFLQWFILMAIIDMADASLRQSQHQDEMIRLLKEVSSKTAPHPRE